MIKPVDLPAAAGIDYGKGDVRHFAQGDAVDVPSLANPTRELAERDNLLASKVNEVVESLNNREQFVPMPVVRTILAPGDQTIVTNYRVPVGFEARVLNAAISTTPSSVSAQLDIYYNSSFGGTSGTSIVTATPGAEFTGETRFYQAGEFILSLKNTGGATLEISASVLLTMRPLGAEGSLLVGSVIQGPKGDPGMTGPPGPPGPPGTGSSGSSGMVWMGTWQAGSTYSVNQVVSFTDSSAVTSSYICVTATAMGESPESTPAKWNAVALGGADGAQGPQGVPGAGGEVPSYKTHVVYGTLTAGDDWSQIRINGFTSVYLLTGETANNIPLLETYITSSAANPGFQKEVNTLAGMFRLAFKGNGTFTLPKALYGAHVDYTNTYTSLFLTPNGTIPHTKTDGTVMLAQALPVGTDQFVLKSFNSQETWQVVTLFGYQPA